MFKSSIVEKIEIFLTQLVEYTSEHLFIYTPIAVYWRMS